MYFVNLIILLFDYVDNIVKVVVVVVVVVVFVAVAAVAIIVVVVVDVIIYHKLLSFIWQFSSYAFVSFLLLADIIFKQFN